MEAGAAGTDIQSLVNTSATVHAVSRGMEDTTWVHFACHGLQHHTDPLASSLLLTDEQCLTLSAIARLALPRARLAFLSACQTATGSATLSDEAVHLAAGMLRAGYHSVVGTMWSIMDRDAPQVAEDFYAHIFRAETPSHTDAAHALHFAVERLREKKGGKGFLSWVPFIHFGA